MTDTLSPIEAQIITRLYSGDSLSVGELYAHLKAESQATITYDKVRVALVQLERKGLVICTELPYDPARPISWTYSVAKTHEVEVAFATACGLPDAEILEKAAENLSVRHNHPSVPDTLDHVRPDEVQCDCGVSTCTYPDGVSTAVQATSSQFEERFKLLCAAVEELRHVVEHALQNLDRVQKQISAASTGKTYP